MNLTLHSREARGTPQNQWFSLAVAKENLSEFNLIPTVAHASFKASALKLVEISNGMSGKGLGRNFY